MKSGTGCYSARLRRAADKLDELPADDVGKAQALTAVIDELDKISRALQTTRGIHYFGQTSDFWEAVDGDGE